MIVRVVFITLQCAMKINTGMRDENNTRIPPIRKIIIRLTRKAVNNNSVPYVKSHRIICLREGGIGPKHVPYQQLSHRVLVHNYE